MRTSLWIVHGHPWQTEPAFFRSRDATHAYHQTVCPAHGSHHVAVVPGRRLATLLITGGLFLFAVAVSVRADGSGVKTGVVFGPPTPDSPRTDIVHLPRFSLIESWEALPVPKENPDSLGLTPPAQAVRSLCRYFDRVFDESSPIASSLSPLEWPLIFPSKAGPADPRRLQAETENLIADNALAFRRLVAFETTALDDTLAAAIATGTPVLLNAPSAPILYGYDRSEPDPWWWTQIGNQREIMFDSERQEQFVYWSDDPASNVAWAITGIDSLKLRGRRTVADGYEWLSRIRQSIRGDAHRGLSPYPLSLRAIRREAESSRTLPPLVEPVDPYDPLGIRRSRRARAYAVALLEHMSAMATDSLEARPLRLALYYYHNALQIFDRLDTLLYDAQPGPVDLSRCRANWGNDVRHPQISMRINEILEWEQRAAGEIETVLSLGKTANH